MPIRRMGCVAVLLITATGVLGACSDDAKKDERSAFADTTGSPSTTASPSTPDEIDRSDNPASAYSAWIGALADHDAATACTLQAPDYTIQLRYDAILVERAELGDPCVDFEALLWEDPDFDSAIKDVAVTQVTAEDALLEVHLATGSRTVRMVYHRAHWRVFSVTDRTDTSPDPTAGPARWLSAWCGLSADQTREEIVASMGEPSGEYTVSDGGEPQLWWAQDQYDFRVYLDVDGSVLELVGDYDALSDEDRAQLACPELRN
ncbi:hypothetical protein F0U44_21885 [Nocardioides humilatus]|uniref:PepSY domain-containing protein n=1 Tax=Nocardioides humilatus TaxID=2607660 RepID=A0A5B1L6Q3_9ACTN|nr:hypothetical protein [Nocardioides humilatus]KAA1415337.1 hypothetical protein F0U44_21885 [Nocardioides humilatus]